MQTLHKNRTFNIKNQYGLSFDGVNEYISIPHSADLSFDYTSSFSISLWFKKTALGTNKFLYAKRGSAAAYGIALLLETNAEDTLDFDIFQDGTHRLRVFALNAGVSAGVWYNTIITYDGTNDVSGMKIYLNGTSKTLTTSANSPLTTSILNTDPTTIGTTAAASILFDGNIDECAVFNVELTATEVLEAYNKGKPTNLNSHSKAANLVAYHRLGDPTAIHDGTNWQIPNSKSGLENKKSILFDGVNEYVDLGNIFNEYIAGASKQFSWSFWVKRPAASVSDQLINKWDNSAANQRELNILWHSDNKFYFYQSTTGSDAPVVVTTNTFTGTTWYHVVCTYDGTAVAGVGRFKIYVNGTSEAITLTGTVGDYFSGTANLQFADNSYGTNPLNGNLDEIRFYNTTLTQAQVTALYNLGTPAEAKDSLTDANLISHWRMGDAPLDTATVIEDVYGSNNGTGTNLESADLEYDAALLGVSQNMESTDISKGAGIV